MFLTHDRAIQINTNENNLSFLPRSHSRLLNVQVDEAAARALSCITSLETLDLSCCQVFGRALEELMWMPRLQQVIVSERQRGELRLRHTQREKVMFK